MRRLELVSANVHRAASDARVAVLIRTGRRGGVGTGIDARRIGLQAQVALSLVHKKWCVGDVAGAGLGKWCRAAVIEWVTRRFKLIIRTRRGSIEIDDAIVQVTSEGSTAAARQIAGERAIVQRAESRPATVVARCVSRQNAVVQRGVKRPAALVVG